MAKKKKDFKEVLKRVSAYLGIALLLLGALLLGNLSGTKFLEWKESRSSKESNLGQESADKKKSQDVFVIDGVTIKPPVEGATLEEQEAFDEAIMQVSTPTKSIVISNEACDLEPKIPEITLNSEVEVSNQSSLDRNLVFGVDELSIEVLAGGTNIFTADFDKGAGIYGIMCGTETIGFLHVTP